MKKLLIILSLVFSINSYAGFKSSINVDFLSSKERVETVSWITTKQSDGRLKCTKYESYEQETNNNTNLRLLLGYDFEITESYGLGLASSISSNGSSRHDLTFNIKPTKTLYLKLGPSIDNNSNLGINLGSELNINESIYLNVNVNADNGKNNTLTTGVGFRF